MTHTRQLLLCLLLTGCGGGSEETPPNNPPTANDARFETTENVSLTVDVLALATDSDGDLSGGITITETNNAVVTVEDSAVRYTPNEDFTGTDTFAFTVTDDDGAPSNAARITVTVSPITETELRISSLVLPQGGYAAMNNAELGATVLSSPRQFLDVPPNTVSFTLSLRGSDVGRNTGLLITDINDPDSNLSPLFKRVVVCDTALCSASRPRRPDQATPRGDWLFRLGTPEQTLDDIDFTDMALEFAVRVGPEPNLEAPVPAAITVRPFLTADSVTPIELDLILDELAAMGEDNGIDLRIRPTIVVSDPAFSEVSSDFTDPRTAELVEMGDPDAANIFFLESFTGSGGIIGIAPGIPGTLGIRSNLNGVLVNATLTRDNPTPYTRTTAEFAFHEMGHLLGLFHTTESNFDHDVLDDTPNCTESDVDGGKPTTDECPDGLNPMFYTNALETPKPPLTADQRRILYYTPIATPEP